MSTTGAYQPRFKQTAPIKGSFPLDHEGECKGPMLDYMLCLNDKGQRNSDCRDLAKVYFDCRMKHNLMAKEDWNKLGYGTDQSSSNTVGGASAVE
uniref:CHCH domain-containing protein n=1 Tax=Plectus sambesii TaxID=2011161 RepID=A0A914UP90_9BILA